MNIVLRREPSMLYETLELIYAWVNGLPPETLTVEAPYCIPAADVARILEDACADLEPQEPGLWQYFGRHPILDESEQFTCLAFCMVYWFMSLDVPELAGQIDSTRAAWERIRRRPINIRAINRFSMDIEALPVGPTGSLASELRKLPVEEDFFLSLLETFSDYSYHMARLREMILPVARRLRPLLEPFVAQAEPLREAWRQFFQETPLADFVAKRTGTIPEKPFDQVCICLRYLGCRYTPIQVDEERNSFWMHLGVAVQPALQQARRRLGPNEQDLAALRLLGDKSRSEMVQALMGAPMSMQELATFLSLNPGTVFRNLNSLTNTGLLIKEIRGDRYYYHANFSYIQEIFRNMLGFYREGMS